MKRTKLLKYLQRFGCQFVREGGNHTIYQNASGSRQTVVLRHSEIKTNIARKICKNVDIPPPDEK